MSLQEERKKALDYLAQLGIKETKAQELMENKRVRNVIEKIEMQVEKPGALETEKKKLLYKVIELAPTAEAAGKYVELIKISEIKTEVDIKNADSIIKNGAEEMSNQEIIDRMKKNVPSLVEMEEVASAVIEENMGEAKAKVLRELKHHPRLQFVAPKTILELMSKLEIKSKEDLSKKKIEPSGEGLTEKAIEELLEMATQVQPPTRLINKKYQQLTIPKDLHSSKDRKWTRYLEGEMQTMHTPFTNYQKNNDILREHIKRTKGQVRVRFPPEPNGHLHIGHAKAMSINFGYKEFYNGWISLRYDDTNPKAEKTKYYEKIKEMVEWMGYKPDAITHASDYFDRLYECALDLIKRGKAYVCHLSREEVAEKRKETMATKIEESAAEKEKIISPWRDRSIEENLEHFQKMKEGHYNEGEAVLRMKMDMESDNPQLWDLIAYRVVKHPHVRTGDKWIIYPSYDFTHCLTDSFEDITHSFCTTEFINSRESYNWLCDALDLYRPVQWEYSRLNITGALLSKRYITKAINEKKFTGWDDPRLSTLEGLRSKGVPAYSIRRFVESLGITTVTSEIPMHNLENIIREDLSLSSKSVAILSPLKVITPTGPILIDQKDFRKGEPISTFYRIQRGNTVLLKNLGPLTLVDEEKRVLEKSENPHNAVIPWLGTDSPTAILEIVQDKEIVEYTTARVSQEISKSPVGVYWQFLRIGFFVRIEDKQNLRFRMVVGLKSSPLLE
ncbi:glutaminyl-tRNA synthetase [Nematocida parisii ERTm1]|uniref:glutaminyl-tRNA synthetase n=1 Tax=Nematocida parisii (strain ERTm1 / ATCC PRA-289) TaxID=881290 RepID=UPI000264B80F|nr:glutaminyl-tRNA synthetase [Nematocida parisii ERTm1]EIJ94912.1 glutaminyl-tRNA synthetase [Nematocida parisii ERTm1]|eukprot:XP_013058268.1 glutaminyl-tRNA synthetase [Nematocida parisii ERTm1]